MYADPKRVRDNRMMLRLSDYEIAGIFQLAELEGEQPSTLARLLLVEAANERLTHKQSMPQDATQRKAAISCKMVA